MGRALGVHPAAALAAVALGAVAWTLLEYLVHRYVLHGIFPDGTGFLRHRLHAIFDGMHGDHHLRPWDGMFINGHLSAVPFGVALALLSFLARHVEAPVFVATLLLGYVIEEWVHYASHFCHFRSRYFRVLRHRHWLHHARGGADTAFGLTSSIWDAICGTGIKPRRPRATPGGTNVRQDGADLVPTNR
jgi:sterol desaturase/sphingolipid hydroxylase (fatty acid hydroxylase superfamily)